MLVITATTNTTTDESVSLSFIIFLINMEISVKSSHIIHIEIVFRRYHQFTLGFVIHLFCIE